MIGGSSPSLINLYWPRKWRAPALVKVKKFWERYREAKIPAPITTPFSYEKQNKGEAIKPLNTYDRIKTSLETVARPASEDEYRTTTRRSRTTLAQRGPLHGGTKTRRGSAGLDSHL